MSTARYETLIDAGQLAALLVQQRPLAILDVSFDLPDPPAGRRAYQQGHIPGARYAHLDQDLSAPKTGRNGRHPLPEREQFAHVVGRWGIAPQTQVVAYDRQGGMFCVRLWWMLKWLGHADVAVLDGGWPAWQTSGGAVETTTHEPLADAAPYPAGPALVPACSAEQVQRSLGRVERLVLDARAPERFRGDVELLDAIGGHIPGARNRFFKDNLQADGRFKPAATLRAEFQQLLAGRPPTDVIHQCGSGVTACHNLLAMEAAGLSGSALYPGSWSEWSADPRRPVAKG